MAICPRCGSSNPSYVPYCGKCGQEMSADIGKESTKDQPQSAAPSVNVEDAGPRPALVWCKSCGKLTEEDRACPSCGEDPSAERPEALARPGTPTSLVGGSCAIVAGLLAVIQGIFFFAGEAVLFTISVELTFVFIILGMIEIALGLASIIAGMNARRRQKYHFSLVGSVLGMVAFGFGIGGFLGLVAVVLIALSHDEFKS